MGMTEDEGTAAFKAGKKITDNPYKGVGSGQAEQKWNAGYREASRLENSAPASYQSGRIRAENSIAKSMKNAGIQVRNATMDSIEPGTGAWNDAVKKTAELLADRKGSLTYGDYHVVVGRAPGAMNSERRDKLDKFYDDIDKSKAKIKRERRK